MLALCFFETASLADFRMMSFSIFSMQFSRCKRRSSPACGDEGNRTPDLLLARQALSHLSYAPICGGGLREMLPEGPYSRKMGLSGLEPPTSRLSGVRSNRLSYKPKRCSCSRLLSHIVSNIVPSAAYGLTVVFGMGTGVSHKRITTGTLRCYLDS